MSNENIESLHRRGSVSNSSVRTSCDELNFTVRYFESELQSIARESSPLSVMLQELKEYSSILRQGGSVALHRGEALMSAQLSERVEKLFTHQPKMDGPRKSWTDIVLWAGPVPRRVCSATQFTVGDTQIGLHKDDRELLCSGRPWGFLSPWPDPGDIEKELQVVEETLADVQKIKDMVNKVISEAATLEQQLSTRRELLWDHRLDQTYTTSKDTAITRTPEAGPCYPHEIRPPRESEIATYLNGNDANAGIQPSQFANPASPKNDGSLVLPTEVVSMDLSDGHPDGSNTQSLHGSPMEHESAPLDRTNHSSRTMATEKASPGITSMANITPTRNTESFSPINGGRRMPVFIKRLVTALNDQQNQQIMRWSEDGNTVVIVDEQELTTKLLPDFNTTTYYSFTQQLKLHGFRKVEKGYEHPLFRRDHPQDMYLIRRKDGKPLPPSSFGSGMLSPSDVANVRSPSSISTPGSSVGYGSARSSPSHPHPLSVGNGVSNGANSRGQNYKVVKRGRKPRTLMQTQQYSDWGA